MSKKPFPSSPRSGRGRGARNAAPRTGTPGPGGRYWLYGLHAVAAALNNPSRQKHDLLLTSEAQEQLPVPDNMLPKLVKRPDIDAVCPPGAVHQGAALLVSPLENPDLEDVLAQRPGPVLLLDQVTDPHNIGAILRSAAAFGAACVVVPSRNAPAETASMAKAASGALDAVPLVHVTNLSRTIKELQNADIWTMGLDAGGTPLHSTKPKGRAALVMGAEGAGMRRLTRESCDEIVSIPMPGAMESLNVSNAAAIALYEMTRAQG
ncbi:23S rRNA (guanosine(2251)-2'-O)-methyltransferase RlmB [Formicincola oecophyllae]|uniref:23S rRNA (Guanosine(2251)-2'-O)-methyltransferase RlmB n=1 Tax=Formicincola oecophyllae TaxID=2558361 RepID=A0A4Y6U8E2_9PROT|nr:23S rRNA (guanosine(2251)-2'-O)-methyltransferase RlmB [Formicincola oecophyllae]QDH13709.1 23S rRNA (guanosine(2251)-2'-O)-methyltransferase RlmB [Formicincola oecophyllae]